ncbi:hypothetical protein VTN77DRAFT_3095 [Rasamsonia byssochlamydoides]|uniref:uncharacterized protein n=1 Tax=Rasamsonia byssochlamydoides TaxID=89139 RepID=UPI003741FBFB
MAGDIRNADQAPSDSSTANSTNQPIKKPKHEFPKSQVGKLWEAFGNPEEPINILPGATYNPTREPQKDISLTESIKSITLKDFTTFYKAPCARDSLLVGLGAGFGAGGIRGILGGLGSVWPACNWAVGTFAVASIVAHEFCQRRRVKELDGMRQAVELMRELKIKKQKEKEQKKAAEEAARQAEEEERRRKSWFSLPNYKFW